MAVVLGFKTSDNLAAAYGLSVTGTMIITTILAFGVIVRITKVKWWVMAPVFLLFFLVDFTFLAANSIKVFEGGWLPILIASLVFILMTTWRKGMRLVKEQLAEKTVSIQSFLKNSALSPPLRVPGTGVYMTQNSEKIPGALLTHLLHNKVLHDRVVLLEVVIEDTPHVPDEERIELKSLNEHLFALRVYYGFKDEIDIPKALNFCEAKGLKIEPDETSYFIGHEVLINEGKLKMANWRKRLFMGLFHNAHSFIDHCKIPANQIVEIGTSVDFKSINNRFISKTIFY